MSIIPDEPRGYKNRYNEHTHKLIEAKYEKKQLKLIAK
jgi:non-homologous end joining protein Ku